MDEELPKEFDLIVIGTGFTESCIAAGASRIGKTVLHLDQNDFYGGTWASLNLENFIGFLENNSNNEIRNTGYGWHIQNPLSLESNNGDLNPAQDDGAAQMLEKLITQADVLEQSRRFNIDFTPKIIYSAGQLVQLLISSNICRYAEFRPVDSVCTLFQNNLLNVPCSRADVFNSKDLSFIEKRILMKILCDCIVYGEEKHDEDALKHRGKTFSDYLKSQNVTEKISTCIMQAIAMCNVDASFEEGMGRTKLFLQSLGRYGNTPFLFPMYGCGEMPQCFCRLCAVFGGIYCLKTSISDIVWNADTNSVALMLGNGNIIQAKHVVSSHGNIPTKFLERNMNVHGHGALKKNISRGVFITSTPLGDETFNGGGGGVNLLRLVDGLKEAIVIQLSHSSGTCPKDYYLFHMTMSAESDDPAKDLQPFMEQIFNDKPNSPDLVFSAFFSITACQPIAMTEDIPIYCTAAPFYELDYNRSIENAKEIFNKMYPETEFLPRAPDPEEIIIDGEDPRALCEVGLPEDLRAQLHELERCVEKLDMDEQMDAD